MTEPERSNPRPLSVLIVDPAVLLIAGVAVIAVTALFTLSDGVAVMPLTSGGSALIIAGGIAATRRADK